MTEPDRAARDARRLPSLHAVTDDRVLAGDRWAHRAARVLEAGGADVALHVRGAGTGPRRLLELVDTLLPVARSVGGALFVNDRVDVALLAEPDGVHLGTASLEPDRARELLGPEAWIGVSCHDPGEVTAAKEKGADYVFLGSIFRTATHPGLEGVGPAGIGAAAERAGELPLIGIGGIGPTEAETLADAGAYGVAAIRGIWDAADPAVAVREYLEGLRD